jgi:predicted RNA-binding Zn-ribbon protein involved in translation (DUF1610 family)
LLRYAIYQERGDERASHRRAMLTGDADGRTEARRVSRYPRAIRDARIKCIACNAPVAVTVDGRYVCVECGEAPIQRRSSAGRSVNRSAVADDD